MNFFNFMHFLSCLVFTPHKNPDYMEAVAKMTGGEKGTTGYSDQVNKNAKAISSKVSNLNGGLSTGRYSECLPYKSTYLRFIIRKIHSLEWIFTKPSKDACKKFIYFAAHSRHLETNWE